MKFELKQIVIYDVLKVKIEVPVRYDEEDIPNDFPLRSGDMWIGTLNLDTKQIEEWPKGKSGRLRMKVCDEGSYTLIDKNGKTVAEIIQDYCPNRLIPGEHGDYIDLEISEDGTVLNFLAQPSLEDFQDE